MLHRTKEPVERACTLCLGLLDWTLIDNAEMSRMAPMAWIVARLQVHVETLHASEQGVITTRRSHMGQYSVFVDSKMPRCMTGAYSANARARMEEWRAGSWLDKKRISVHQIVCGLTREICLEWNISDQQASSTLHLDPRSAQRLMEHFPTGSLSHRAFVAASKPCPTSS